MTSHSSDNVVAHGSSGGAQGGLGTVFLVSGGQKRRYTDTAAFQACASGGSGGNKPVVLDSDVVDSLLEGLPLNAAVAPECVRGADRDAWAARDSLMGYVLRQKQTG